VNEMVINKYFTLLKNTLIFSMGTFGSSVIGLLMLPIFTRVLITSDYGQLDIILTTISLLLPILTLDIIQSVFRFTLDDIGDKKKKKVLTSSLIVAFISLIIIILLYIPLRIFLSVFKDYYIFFLLIFQIQFVLQIFKTFIRAEKKLKTFAFSDIIQTFSFALLGILFVVNMKMGLTGYLTASLSSMIIALLFIFIVGKVYTYIKIRSIDLKMLRKMIKYSIPLIPNGLSWWIMVSSDRYMLVYFLNYGSAGIYSVANKFPLLISLFNTIFYQAWQISSIEEYKNKDKTIFYSKVFSYLYIVILFGIIILSFFLKPLTLIMLGEEFKSAWQFIPFLVLGVAFHSFSSFYGVGYLASKKTGGAFRTSIYGALVNIGINLVFIPIIGIQAASISTFLGFLVMWITRLVETKKYINIKIELKIFLPLFLLTIISLFIIYIDTYLVLLIQIPCLLVGLILIKSQIKEIFLFIKSLIIKNKG